MLFQVVDVSAQASAEQGVCSMHVTLHSLQVQMAGGGQPQAQAILSKVGQMEVSNFAFGGPEHRFSHSRLPMSLVLPAVLPFSLLAVTGKASSSMLDSIDDKPSPVAWSYELSKLLDELSELL